MASLTIYRAAVEVATVEIDLSTVLIKKLMTADKINATWVSATVLPIELGDYVTFEGSDYYLNFLPVIEKENDGTYKYTAVFHGVLYNLYKKAVISSDLLTDFSYTGTAEDFVLMIVGLINLIDAGWTVGEVDATEKKTIQFVNDNCRTALTKIADAFGFEFELVGKAINLQEAVGTIRDITLEYGQNKGLYTLTRKGVEDANALVTRVYGFGGTKNIPYTYRNRAKRLTFEGRFLEKSVATFGVREYVYINDDIYPRRTATLTAVNMEFEAEAFNVADSYVVDTSLDFNINEHLVEGLTPRIVFKSGDLSGYEFEIWKYEHDTRKLYINPYTDSDGYAVPNPTNKAAVGDSYTLVDLRMPQTYINTAEQELQQEAQKYLDTNCVPKALYLCTMDPKFIKAESITLDAGDLVKILDAYLGIDRPIRINQITIPLANKYKITAIIADFIPYTLQEKVTQTAAATSRAISNITNQITNQTFRQTVNNVTNNTTVVNEGNVNKITVFDREFFWEKAFDNTDVGNLEIGDIISDNYYNRYLFVKKWQYIGGERNLRASWDEIETLDFTPEVV